MLPDDSHTRECPDTKDGSHFSSLHLGAATVVAIDASDLAVPPSPNLRLRSLSDGGASTPVRGRLSPSALLSGPSNRLGSRDDIYITSSHSSTAPMTPRRPPLSVPTLGYPPQQMAGEQQQRRPLQDQKDQQPTTPVSRTHLHNQLQQQQQLIYLDQPYMSNSIPLSPKLESSQIYASHTNILPRRSRGLDFSRAATSLHHSTLAEQPSPDSSPSNSGRGAGSHEAMAIPRRRGLGDYAGPPESSTSLWSVMGRGTRDSRTTCPSSSLGSANNAIACSDSSTTSGDDDSMDEDMEEPFVTTPQVGKTSMPSTSDGLRTTMPWLPSSPAMGSLLSFQHRQRPRKQPKRKFRGPLGLGFSSALASPANLMPGAGSVCGGGGGSGGSGSGIANLFSRSPPGNTVRDLAQYRRESISWAANQLHISGSESDDNIKTSMEGDGPSTTSGREGPRNVIRRAVTRRGNLLPKTKGFARIRAALAEESAPAEAEFRREAEIVRQVLDNEVDQSSLPPPPLRSTSTTASSSPRLFDNVEDIVDEFMAMDASSSTTGLGLSATNLRQQVNRIVGGGRPFWERPERSVSGGAVGAPGSLRATTPPPSQARGPASSIGMADDISMDSPLGSGVGELKIRQGNANAGYFVYPHGAMFPMTAVSSPGSGIPQVTGPGCSSSSSGQQQRQEQPQHQHQQPVLPSAAEITRRINSKRRRDDDLDPVSFKRRAVSPGISVHSSPVMQSPLQRDVPPWAGLTAAVLSSRSGSGGGNGGNSMGLDGSGSGGGGGGGSGASGGNGRAVSSNKGRVGFRAMADANDSITRLSIE